MTPEAPCLQTARLKLRGFLLSDAPLMLAVWNSPAFLRFVGDRGVRSEAQARDALADGPIAIWQEFGYGPFRVGLKDDTGIGICGLFKRPELDVPDLGIALLPEFYRQGYGVEAATATLDYCRDDLGKSRIAAIVSADNEASLAMLKHLGFEHHSAIDINGESVDLLYCDLSPVPAADRN